MFVMSEAFRRKAIPPDYDQDPERFRLARWVLRGHTLVPDVHARVAQRMLEAEAKRIGVPLSVTKRGAVLLGRKC
jgi:hypothetical protein